MHRKFVDPRNREEISLEKIQPHSEKKMLKCLKSMVNSLNEGDFIVIQSITRLQTGAKAHDRKLSYILHGFSFLFHSHCCNFCKHCNSTLIS